MTLPLAPFGPRSGLRGMVAAADQLAASAGVGMLAHGGSAADAAVATGAVMAVVGPHLCGLGGDVLAMVAPPGSTPEALLSVGRAGSGSDPASLRAEGMTVMPLRHDVRSVPVPGAVDGWLALHGRHGRLPLADVLAPAIELASDGFAASVMLALATHLVHALPGAGQLCPAGPLEVGQRVRVPGLARTLGAIASGGRDAFYDGEFGHGLLELGGGHFAPSDLATSMATWCAPLRQRAWGHDLWTVPPPSQGYLTLAGAWVAETAGLGTDPDDPEWAHLLVEAWRAVGHDRPDVLFDGADGAALLGAERLAAAAARVDRQRAAAPDVAPGQGTPAGTVARMAEGDTTHLCALDAEGLGVSLTQSNALDFGSHLIEPATGVFLHNRGVGFSLVPGHPAELSPGRRPPHTLSPTLVTAADGALDASRRGHGRRCAAADHRPAPGPAAPGRTGPGPCGERAAPHPRRALRRAVPPVVGRRPHGAGRGGLPTRVARPSGRPRPSGAGHPRLRPRRRRVRPDHRGGGWGRRVTAPGRGVGPAQPRGCGDRAVTRPGLGSGGPARRVA